MNVFGPFKLVEYRERSRIVGLVLDDLETSSGTERSSQKRSIAAKLRAIRNPGRSTDLTQTAFSFVTLGLRIAPVKMQMRPSLTGVVTYLLRSWRRQGIKDKGRPPSDLRSVFILQGGAPLANRLSDGMWSLAKPGFSYDTGSGRRTKQSALGTPITSRSY